MQNSFGIISHDSVIDIYCRENFVTLTMLVLSLCVTMRSIVNHLALSIRALYENFGRKTIRKSKIKSWKCREKQKTFWLVNSIAKLSKNSCRIVFLGFLGRSVNKKIIPEARRFDYLWQRNLEETVLTIPAEINNTGRRQKILSRISLLSSWRPRYEMKRMLNCWSSVVSED